MSRLVYNLILSGILVSAPLFFIMTSPSMAQEAAPDLLAASPLEACPDTPNCVHEAFVFTLAPTELVPLVMEALDSKQLDSAIQGSVDLHRIEAVYNAWQYKDDVHIAVEPHEKGAILYIRSASREGHWDLGVNNRRVKRILSDLNKLLD